MSGPVAPIKVVLAGEMEEKLRAREAQYLAQANSSGRSIVPLDVAKLSDGQRDEILGTSSLFGSTRLLRVINLEKVRSPKALTTWLELLATSADDVLITIPSALTPAKQKALGAPWKLETFPLPAVLFQFLEALGVQPLAKTHALFRAALAAQGEWGTHAMVARQVRLLLAAKLGTPIAAPPFVQKKLQSQAQHWSETELTDILERLFQTEWQFKSGKKVLSWDQQFDILLVKLYDGRIRSRQSRGVAVALRSPQTA